MYLENTVKHSAWSCGMKALKMIVWRKEDIFRCSVVVERTSRVGQFIIVAIEFDKRGVNRIRLFTVMDSASVKSKTRMLIKLNQIFKVTAKKYPFNHILWEPFKTSTEVKTGKPLIHPRQILRNPPVLNSWFQPPENTDNENHKFVQPMPKRIKLAYRVCARWSHRPKIHSLFIGCLHVCICEWKTTLFFQLDLVCMARRGESSRVNSIRTEHCFCFWHILICVFVYHLHRGATNARAIYINLLAD